MLTPLSRARLAGLLVLLTALACGGDDGGGDAAAGGDGSTRDGGGGADGSTRDGGGADGSTRDGGSADGASGGDASLDGASGADASVGCRPTPCAGRIYACGDCEDNDGDGAIDSADPDCLGACDNNESGYSLGIPGGEVGRCDRDCYYDTNQGSGNDGCEWDAQCDPLAPGASCDFVPPGERTGSIQCPEPQSEMCRTECAPITPNGCDCFGCCELPARSGNFVFLGSADETGPTCTPENVEDPTKCFPCTPVADFCFNECERCEVCLGGSVEDLPADCFERPDAGTPDAGDRDAGAMDAGTPIDPRCPDGRQPCGAPSDPACPDGLYCLTGCCTVFF